MYLYSCAYVYHFHIHMHKYACMPDICVFLPSWYFKLNNSLNFLIEFLGAGSWIALKLLWWNINESISIDMDSLSCWMPQSCLWCPSTCLWQALLFFPLSLNQVKIAIKKISDNFETAIFISPDRYLTRGYMFKTHWYAS